MAYAQYQIRVRYRDHEVHASGTSNYDTAEQRCRDEVVKAGLGAQGRVAEYISESRAKPPTDDQLRTLYEVRLAYDPERTDGSTIIIHETDDSISVVIHKKKNPATLTAPPHG